MRVDKKNPILIYILKNQSINQYIYFTKNGHIVTFRCNSKEKSTIRVTPTWPLFCPQYVWWVTSVTSVTYKNGQWDGKMATKYKVTTLPTHRHTYSKRRMPSRWTPSSSSMTAEPPHLSRNETQESSTSTENRACSIGRSDPHTAPSLARNSWGTRREPYRY